MLNFNDFTEEIRTVIAMRMPNARVNVGTYMKNNDKVVTALTIYEGDSNVSPTLRLEDYYRTYCRNGNDLGAVADEMLRVYNTYKVSSDFNVGDYVESFEAAKPHIVPKLLNKERNEKLLGDLVHSTFLDLAVTYSICVQDIFGRGGIAISNAMLEEWDVDLFTLHKAAVENLNTTVFRFDQESILSGSGDTVDDLTFTEGFPYVATSVDGIYGANAMLDKDALRAFAEKANAKKVYVVPLSIGEILLIKDDDMVGLESLTRVIKDINREVNSVEYFLSDTVYLYSADDNAVTIPA